MLDYTLYRTIEEARLYTIQDNMGTRICRTVQEYTELHMTMQNFTECFKTIVYRT